MDTVIEIKDLKKSFENNDVLNGLSLDLKRGENLALLGKSGSGKSVLIKCIVQLIKSDSGTIKVLNRDLNQMSKTEIDELRQKVGYLFQGGALYDSMSVRENLEFPVRRTQKKKNKKELNDMVMEVLDSVGLTEAVDKMPAELSGGMKKRIGLARTLILRPEIILYDEPTTGLDPVTSGEISELMLKIQDKYNTSSIIVTHDMKCVKMTSNKIKLLMDGKFYAEGTFDELSKSEDDNVKGYFN
ncbi:MAG TPA: ATP-binding cassette domain-containing protein [Tangfeifania sp.]|nr:ATP-binding cassette domain-containing protein [Tangfeifania sp.]